MEDAKGIAVPTVARNKVLIVSHKFDPHADYMVALLEKMGIGCLRWILGSFPAESRFSLETTLRGFEGELETIGWRADLSSIRSVWYRHPSRPQFEKELSPAELQFAEGEARAAFTGLSYAYPWFWVNHPGNVAVADSKILQLKVANELGLRIPRTLVTNDPVKLRQFFQSTDGNMIYKPFNSGFFGGTQKICYTTPIGAQELECGELIRTTPGIFQENIRKKLELRVTVIGRKVFAVEIHTQDSKEAKYDWREADLDDLPHVPHTLPVEIERRCLAFLDRFSLVFGAMDLILTTEGEYIFLENNPRGQFGWIEARTDMPLTITLAKMLVEGRVV